MSRIYTKAYVELENELLVLLHNVAYSDYIVGAMTHSLRSYEKFERSSSLSRQDSRVIYLDDEPVGFIGIARREKQLRVASMAIVPSARNRGLGRALLNECIESGAEHAMKSIELECIESNKPARELYSKLGFRAKQRLLGFEGGIQSMNCDEFKDCELSLATELLDEWREPSTPWQSAGWSLQEESGLRAASMGNAVAVYSLSEGSIKLWSIAVCPSSRRKGQATRLLQALANRHLGLQWGVNVLVPERYSQLFSNQGLQSRNITQLHMYLRLN